MGKFTSTISETVLLDNGKRDHSINTVQFTDITQVTTKCDRIMPIWSGSGIEILRFVDSEEEQIAGSYVKDKVEYIRVSNLSATDDCEIFYLKTNDEYFSTVLGPNKSWIGGSAEFSSLSSTDYVEAGIWDTDYYSEVSGLNVIKAKASGSAVDLEIIVASK